MKQTPRSIIHAITGIALATILTTGMIAYIATPDPQLQPVHAVFAVISIMLLGFLFVGTRPAE